MSKENVLMISSDESLLDENSRSFKRHKKYAGYFNKLTIFILSERKGKFTCNNLEVISLEAERIKDFFKLLKKACFFCRQRKFNVITTQNPFLTGLLGVYLKFKFKIPLNIQNHSELFSNPYFRKESLNNYLCYLIGKVTCKFADSLRFVSIKEMNSIKHSCKEHILIPEDFDYFFQKKEKKKHNQIVYVGRLSKEKNIPLLLKAFKKVSKNFPKLILKIVGKGEEREKLISLTKKLGIEKKVLFVGSKNKPELKKIFKNTDFLVLPSFYEGWGLVCNEALFSGLPVIITNTGCANNIVINNKTGIVVPINDLNALVTAIKKLYKNNKFRYKLGRNGQKIVKQKKFNQEYLTRKWVGLLKKTAKNKR